MRRTTLLATALATACLSLHAEPDATNAPTAALLSEAAATPAPGAPAAATEPADTFRFRIYAYVASFHWEESFAGAEIVDEQGPLFGLGFAFDRRLVTESLPVLLLGNGDFYFGEVDYDGGLQNEDGTVTPFASDTTYAGVRGQLAFGSPLALGASASLMPYGGAGARGWLRTLDTEIDDDEVGTHGYEEAWGTAYGVLGAQLDLRLAAGRTLFANGQVNLPFWNGLLVDLSNVGGPDDSELDPEREAGWQAEAGLIAGRLGLVLFYEAQSFGESDINEDGFFQPDSEATIAGARVSYDL